MMNHQLKDRVRRVFDPIVGVLVAARIHPNVLTVAGLIFAIIGGVAAAQGRIREGASWLLLSGVLDMTDGPVARRMGISSRQGAFLDSTLDRLAEGAFFSGLAWFYAGGGGAPWTVLGIVLIVVGSFQVSYARARGEGLGVECRVGLMERPERLVFTIVACYIGGVALPVLLWVLAVLTHATAAHRLVHIHRRLGSAASTDR